MNRDLTLIPRHLRIHTTYTHAFAIAYQAGVSDDRMIATTIHKALLAMAQADQPTYQTPSGKVKAKTRVRCQVERARLDTLLDLLADWDHLPLGMTEVSVEERLRRHLYNVDAPWTTAMHSMPHKVDAF